MKFKKLSEKQKQDIWHVVMLLAMVGIFYSLVLIAIINAGKNKPVNEDDFIPDRAIEQTY